MQKAIYRHVRLKKGFHNVEMMDGVAKLRIPDLLLREKMRTQSRFEASIKGTAPRGALIWSRARFLLRTLPNRTLICSNGVFWASAAPDFV